jgi:hypothetical protein
MIELESLGFAPDFAARQVSPDEAQPVAFVQPVGSTELRFFVRIETAGTVWFAGFKSELGYEHRLLACPNPAHLCVVSGGDGYLIDVSAPRLVLKVEPVPVLRAIGAPKREIVILADFADVFAYNAKAELVWRTHGLSQDGIKLLRVDRDYLVVDCWMVSREAWERFQVDLATGSPHPALKEGNK